MSASDPLADIGVSYQHEVMHADDYFLPSAANDVDLAPWRSVMPSPKRVLRTNLFGDHFVLDHSGAVHILDRGGMVAQCIADTEEQFWRGVQEDSEGWQLRSLVNECRKAGMLLTDGQCYAYTTLPVFGGDYKAENVWVARWVEWRPFTDDLFQQIKDLPDGTTITFRVVE